MAISLNSLNSTVSNHGTRITALENKVSSGFTRVQLLGTLGSGTGNLAQSFLNFDIILIQANNSGAGARISHAFDAKSMATGVLYNIPGGSGDSGNDYMYFKFNSVTQVQITTNRYMAGIINIIGMKFS